MYSLEFALAAGDGVAVQAGDLGQQGNPSRAVLPRQKASQESPSAFVGGSYEAVDPTVLLGK
jgi:hypothetical protein